MNKYAHKERSKKEEKREGLKIRKQGSLPVPIPERAGPFKKWLKKQTKEKRPVLTEIELDFAADVARDKAFKEPSNLVNLKSWLQRRNAIPAAIRAGVACFNKWQEHDKNARIDGLGRKDVEGLRKATRQVWSWSYPKKLVIERCLDEDGFSHCEQCKTKVPRIYVDHIEPVGLLDAGYFERLFCPSTKLQGLCKKCHDAKTKLERASKKKTVTKKAKPIDDFY